VYLFVLKGSWKVYFLVTVQLKCKVTFECIWNMPLTCLRRILHALPHLAKKAWQLIKSCCSFIARFCTLTDTFCVRSGHVWMLLLSWAVLHLWFQWTQDTLNYLKSCIEMAKFLMSAALLENQNFYWLQAHPLGGFFTEIFIVWIWYCYVTNLL